MSSTPRDESAEREAWLRRLEEAAAVPAGEPSRRRLEAELVNRGGWALAHWNGLVQDSADWREALESIEPPDGLAVRLEAIADEHESVGPRFGSRVQLVRAAAAVLILGLGLFALLRSDSTGVGSDSIDRRLNEVALLALSDHLDTHDQDVLSSDPVTLARDLQPHIPFPIDLPRLGSDLIAVGGRRCTLGSHVVAFTAWRGPGGRLTLLQLRRSDFGLPSDLPEQMVHPEGEAARGRPLDVFFFGRGDFVWVVVADDAEDLRRVRRAVARS